MSACVPGTVQPKRNIFVQLPQGPQSSFSVMPFWLLSPTLIYIYFFPSLHSTQPSHPPLFHSYFLSPGLCHEGLSASASTAQSRQPQPLPMAGFWAQSHLTGRFVCCCEPISQCITHGFVQKVNVGQSSLIAAPRSANGKVGCLSAPASLRGLLKWRLCL